MPIQNPAEIKEKILRTLRVRGPSIPVYLAREAEQSILFTSAFLSELFSEKKIKQSHLRVGSSPVYFIQGQEYALEKFSSHLKSREKDAFALLKEKKFLIDEEQEPAIRVALRAIKDFAVPFEKDSRLVWRYFTTPESEFVSKKETIAKKITHPQEVPVLPELQQSSLAEPVARQSVSEQGEPKLKEPQLDIFDKPKFKPAKSAKKPARKKTSQGKNDKFFNKVKDFLLEKNIEIIDIQSFSKNDLVLKVKENSEEKLLIAYNKKRVTESDLTKAHKKSQILNSRYIILNLGETPKKLENIITAIKDLDRIDRIK